MSTPTQDLPPPGGFGHIPYRRHIPKRGPPGGILIAGGFCVIVGGMLLHARGVRISRELDREKRQTRLMLLPLLKAEEDLEYLEKSRKSRMIEGEIMGKVEGWQVGEKPYHSTRFVKDSVFLT